MNNLTSFLALTAAIFGAITALLVVLSHIADTEGMGLSRSQEGPLDNRHARPSRSAMTASNADS